MKRLSRAASVNFNSEQAKVNNAYETPMKPNSKDNYLRFPSINK